MKKYRVKVNGKIYEVELEAIEEVKGSVEVKSNEVTTKATGEGTMVVAPIAGKVIDVKVAVNDSVKKGQVVAIVEAMKLENEIVSPVDGVVKEVVVSKGQTVKNKDLMIVIK